MNTEFHVVVNHEEQFSIWPTFKSPPNGWSIVGKPAARNQCLETIRQLWTDIHPKSLRRKTASSEPQQP